MVKIPVWVPESLLEAADRVVMELETTRSALIRQALRRYVEDIDDLNLAVKRLRDPADCTMNWQEVRNALLNTG